MELKGPRVREAHRGFEPLRGLHAVFATTHQSHDSFRVEAPGVIDCLKEDLVKLVDFRGIGSVVARRLVDGLERNQTGLASEFSASLVPQPIELLLDHGQIGTGGGDIGPACRI